MRIAERGEVWEWCAFDSNSNETRWEPMLLLERLEGSCGLYRWKALDLLTGEVAFSYNVPRFGWEKVE